MEQYNIGLSFAKPRMNELPLPPPSRETFHLHPSTSSGRAFALAAQDESLPWPFILGLSKDAALDLVISAC